MTAQKYESAYYDGSSRVSTIVNVPTTETLVMNLNVLGFKNINIIVDEKSIGTMFGKIKDHSQEYVYLL